MLLSKMNSGVKTENCGVITPDHDQAQMTLIDEVLRGRSAKIGQV